MNQAPLSPSPVRPTNPDAPDIFFVFRHYRWLVIIGTILGTVVGAALFEYLLKYSPKFKAEVNFQVMPQQTPIGEATSDRAREQTQEELTRFIRRQMLVIEGDSVLDLSLVSTAFQKDYHDLNSGRKSQWLTDHSGNAKKSLQKDLEISPISNTDVFRITMTAGDPVESANIVNAVSGVYVEVLKKNQKQLESERLQDLRNAMQSVDDIVKNKESKLADFRKARNISAVTMRHTIEVTTLGELNKDVIHMQMEVTAASAHLESIKKQVAAGTLQLSPEMEQYVENDPQIRSLEQQKLSLLQDREVARTQFGEGSKTLLALDTRIVTVGKQTDDRREELRAKARLQMQESAQSVYDSLLGRTQDLQSRRDDKERQVRDLDNQLVEYNQMVADVTSQQEILKNLREQYTREQLTNQTDYSRVRRLGGEAAAPTEVAWPVWYSIVLPGFVLGLLASFALGYVLELTNTRVRTPRDITRSMQLPLLGFVPDQQDDAALTGDIGTSIRSSPASMIAESFRQIRGRLAAQSDGKPLSTLLVASIAPGGGASTVASNLANGMALNDMRVLLVDANFYRPGVKGLYKNVPAAGFSDVLSNPAALDSAIVPCLELPRLHLLGAGSRPTTGATEMLESKAFRDVLNQLKTRYDLIIFDGAPLSLVADSVSLASKVDGVVAVVRAGVVSRGTVARVREQLRQVRANLLGVVLNAAQTHGAGYFKQNYRSFYEYASQGDRVAVTK